MSYNALAEPGATGDPRAMEAALLGHRALVDCRVLARHDAQGWVAYFAAVGPCAVAELDRRIGALSGGRQVSYVPVSSLPLTASGEIDEEALRRLPILDAELVARSRRHLLEFPGVLEAEVRAEERVVERRAIHLSDAVPGGAARRVIDQPVGPQVERSTDAIVGRDVPAISHGEPLAIGPGTPATLVETLERAARAGGHAGIVHVRADGASVQSYSELLQRASRILHALRARRLQPGDPVILHVGDSQEFFEAFWGCVLGGFVPVPTSPSLSYSGDDANAGKLAQAWRMLDRPLVVAAEAAQPQARAFLEKDSPAIVTTVGDLVGADEDREWHRASGDDVTLMMLTSGSTGVPKGVPLTNWNLVCRSIGSQQMNRFSAGDITLNWMPLDHVAGLIYFHLRDVFLCCRQVHAPTQLVLQNPLVWLDLIDRYRATVTFAPNFAFGLVNDCANEIGRRRWNLSTMRFVLNGAEAIVARTARRFLTLLAPHGLASSAIHPAWGMSETSSGVIYSNTFSLETTADDDPLVEVGAPLPGLSIRIVDQLGAVVPEGTVGRLQVRGATVTPGYFRRPDLNASSFSPDGWFDTGDLSFIRNGHLTIAGREKDDIVINAIKYYSHEIESVVETVEGVVRSFAVACAVRQAGGDTEDLAVFFVPAEGSAVADAVKEIRRTVAKRVGITPTFIVPVSRADIPKTAIGKIQRTEVRRRFEAGHFEEQLKSLDLATENANTLPDWFFRRVWRRKQATVRRTPSHVARTVVFAEGELSDRLCDLVAELGQSLVVVVPGRAFRALGDARFSIRPDEPADYLQLMREAARDSSIDTIFHFWGSGPSTEGRPVATERGFDAVGLHSLLYLLQALAAPDLSTMAVRLLVVSDREQLRDGADPISLRRSPILGLVRMVRHEFEAVDAAYVALGAGDARANASLLLEEAAAGSRDAEVALIDGERWTPTLERVIFKRPRVALPFERGGLYLLTGGLGGIAIELATYLLREHAARILLVGRRPLSDRDEAYRSLATMAAEHGADLMYAEADVCDMPALTRALEAARLRWNTDLAGVIHLAGIVHDRLLIDETREGLDRILAPKIVGGLNLHSLVAERPGTLFVSFASVIGYFGAMGNGAYASANAFLDALAASQRRDGLKSHCITWSLWDDVGMSRDLPTRDVSAARGFRPVSRTQGVHSLLAAICRDEPRLVVGLDQDSPFIRPFVADSFATEGLRAYVQPSTETAIPERGDLVALDGAGTPASLIWQRVAVLPTAGAQDADHGRAVRNRQAGRGAADNLEREIARIWQDVLKVDTVDVNSTFLDLGGSSLLLARVYARLKEHLTSELSMTELFRYPTVASLASHLGARVSPESAEIARDRNRGLDRRSKMLRARRSVTVQ